MKNLLTILGLMMFTLLSCQAEAKVGFTKKEMKKLNEQTIVSVEIRQVQLNYPRLVGKNSRLGLHGRGPKVTIGVIKTSDGSQGIGAIHSMSAEKLAQRASQMKGKPVTELFTLEEGPTTEAAKAFDMPMYDLVGVILNKPVYKLFGKPASESIKTYSGMIYMDDLEFKDKEEGIAQVLENCRYDYDYGYRQFKLKIGRGAKWMNHDEGLARDIEVTRRIHAEFPDVDILVDANDGYSADDCIAYLKGVEGISIWWFEEPFAENEADYRKLREWINANGRSETLLADGEYNPKLEHLMDLCDKGLLDVYLDDILGYGFTNWRNLLKRLEEKGISASPHNWGDAIKATSTAHLALALGGVCTVEGVTCTSDELDFGGAKIVNGYYYPSKKPGFGMTLIEK